MPICIPGRDNRSLSVLSEKVVSRYLAWRTRDLESRKRRLRSFSRNFIGARNKRFARQEREWGCRLRKQLSKRMGEAWRWSAGLDMGPFLPSVCHWNHVLQLAQTCHDGTGREECC